MLTTRELAARIPCAVRTIAKWMDEGLPVEQRGRGGRPNKFNESAVRKWLAKYTAAQKPGVVGAVAQERARKERAQAILAEQTFQMRARKLLPVEEVEKLWSAEVTAVRAVILSSYTTHADRVHRAAILEGVVGVEEALKDLAHEVLRELSNPDRDIAPKAADGGSIATVSVTAHGAGHKHRKD